MKMCIELAEQSGKNALIVLGTGKTYMDFNSHKRN